MIAALLSIPSSAVEKTEPNRDASPHMNYPRQHMDTVVTGNFEKVGLKQKAIHEFIQFLGIFLYLAFFFCAVSTYRMLLLSDFRDSYINYSFSVINAFVIAKVILIG